MYMNALYFINTENWLQKVSIKIVKIALLSISAMKIIEELYECIYPKTICANRWESLGLLRFTEKNKTARKLFGLIFH